MGFYSATFIVLLIAYVQRSESLRCYSGSSGITDVEGASNIIENCGGTCTKILFDDKIEKGCSASVGGGDVCDSAPTVTVCYCGEDLCNTASTIKTTLTFLGLTFGALRLFLS